VTGAAENANAPAACGYSRVPIGAARLRSAEALRVLIAICRFVDADGEGWPRYETISRMTGIDMRSLPRAFRTLEAAGLIKRKPRNGRSTLYMVQFSEGLTAPAPTAPAPYSATADSASAVRRNQAIKETHIGAPKPQKKTQSPKANSLPALQAFKLTPELRASLSAECPGQANKLDLLAARFRDDEFWQRAFSAGRYSNPVKTFTNFVRREEGFARDRGGRSPPARPNGTAHRDYTPEQKRAIYGT
jgi:Helix-turn-helix domain